MACMAARSLAVILLSSSCALPSLPLISSFLSPSALRVSERSLILPAAVMRSAVSLIVIAFVAVIVEMRRASTTMRSMSTVSFRSALLK